VSTAAEFDQFSAALVSIQLPSTSANPCILDVVRGPPALNQCAEETNSFKPVKLAIH
jgi:hypothetical protein